ncbi:MAG: hypothetical protein A4E49_01424 [Methanosaeta sp. PtaU1.Bin112]|nr:MAG: hypothetical protein A4E49_01424 [Methanosaeta sp. PtaU1.Bin112]
MEMAGELGQEDKIAKRIIIVLMALLLVIVLATPASAISLGKKSKTTDNCEVKCTKYEQVIDNSYKNEKTVAVYSFIVGGVKKNLYVKYAQDCTSGHYGRTCTPFARCKVNNLCEQSGPILTETSGDWETCSKWEITDVWVASA